VKTPGGRGGRTPRRFGAQPTRLETLDDDLGPLGPLGATVPQTVEEPPELPQKEQLAIRNSGLPNAPSQISHANNLGQNEEDENGLPRKARVLPQVRSPSQNAPRQTQPSVSIEQAARPTFNISIGDPHKVGDLTSSHTVYQVRTKVGYKRGTRAMLRLTRSTDHIKSIQTTRVRSVAKIP